MNKIDDLCVRICTTGTDDMKVGLRVKLRPAARENASGRGKDSTARVREKGRLFLQISIPFGEGLGTDAEVGLSVKVALVRLLLFI